MHQCRLLYEEFKSDQYELVAKKEIDSLKEEMQVNFIALSPHAVSKILVTCMFAN